VNKEQVMKRDDLKKLLGDQIGDDVIDKIMAEHGKDIEGKKAEVSTLTTERDALKTQLDQASQQIDSFKTMDIEGVKKSAEEWKAKAEQAAADAKAQVSKLKFDHALEASLTGAKARNAKAVTALLDTTLLKMGEDGAISGLKEQLEKIQSEHDYLFVSDVPTPTIVTGGSNRKIMSDPIVDAARKAAGLKVE
jgi:chromosome segregation ATPase